MATTRVQIGQRIFNYPFTDSLLTSVAYMNPRYDGSKLVSSQKNVYTEGDVSYGKEANIIEKTNTIYEFDWGGGGFPEIPYGGAVHLSKIIILDEYDEDNSDVLLVKPSDTPDWDLILNRTIKEGDNISLNQYENNSIELPISNVVALPPGYTVPVLPADLNVVTREADYEGFYYLPTINLSETYGSINNDIIEFDTASGNDRWRLLLTDGNGNYIPSSGTDYHTEAQVLADFNNVWNSGNRIFITLFSELSSSTSTGATSSVITPYSINPIEIVSAKSISGVLTIKLKEDSGIVGNGLGDGEVGALIWVAGEGDFLALRSLDPNATSDNYSNLQQGALYREFSQDIIKQKFKPLTQYFGENPQT